MMQNGLPQQQISLVLQAPAIHMNMQMPALTINTCAPVVPRLMPQFAPSPVVASPSVGSATGCYVWMPLSSPSVSTAQSCSASTTPDEDISTVFPEAPMAQSNVVPILKQQHAAEHPQEDIDDEFGDLPPLNDPDNRRYSFKMRASVSTPLPGLAGAFAKRLRRGIRVELEAMGPAAVAQVMRGLILARSFLDRDGISFEVDIGFVSDLEEVAEGSHPSLSFPLSRQDAKLDVSSGRTIFINSNAVVGKSAGAIAKELRASPIGVACNISAGPSANALNIAAKALALAKVMLRNDGLSLKIQPVIPKNARPKPEVQTLTFAVIMHKAGEVAQ